MFRVIDLHLCTVAINLYECVRSIPYGAFVLGLPYEDRFLRKMR